MVDQSKESKEEKVIKGKEKARKEKKEEGGEQEKIHKNSSDLNKELNFYTKFPHEKKAKEEKRNYSAKNNTEEEPEIKKLSENLPKLRILEKQQQQHALELKGQEEVSSVKPTTSSKNGNRKYPLKNFRKSGANQVYNRDYSYHNLHSSTPKVLSPDEQTSTPKESQASWSSLNNFDSYPLEEKKGMRSRRRHRHRDYYYPKKNYYDFRISSPHRKSHSFLHSNSNEEAPHSHTHSSKSRTHSHHNRHERKSHRGRTIDVILEIDS